MQEKEILIKVNVMSRGELSPDDAALVEAACVAARAAYAPYSQFCVGAAVRLDDDTIVTGNNQENAAFPSGICAERVALFSANARHPDRTPRTLAVVAMKNGKVLDSPVSPCGACRQVMAGVEERYKHSLRVLMCGADTVWGVDSSSSLLPFQFTDESMRE